LPKIQSHGNFGARIVDAVGEQARIGGEFSIASRPRLHPKIPSVAARIVIPGLLIWTGAAVLNVGLLMVDSDPITGGWVSLYV
jgi:hypothetical protein